MKIRRTSLLVLACLLFLSAQAQVDTIPRIVASQLDWVRFTASAPKFQQKDLTVRVVRLNDLAVMYSQETSPAWQNDWHYVYLDKDHLLDAIYCGQTKYNKGWRTIVAMGDSAYRYPISLNLSGYVSSLRHDSTGLELIQRRDPGEKEYITEITHHYYNFRTDSAQSRWQLRFVSSTEIPELGPQPDLHTLRLTAQLRTSPRQVTEPAIDYDQDGRVDAAGNVVAEFAPGARLRRYAVVRQGDLEWSFVVIYAAPKAGSVLKASTHPKCAYAGWIPSGAFLK